MDRNNSDQFRLEDRVNVLFCFVKNVTQHEITCFVHECHVIYLLIKVFEILR